MTKPEIIANFVEENRRIPTNEELEDIVGAKTDSTKHRYRIMAEGELAKLPPLAPNAPPAPAPPSPPTPPAPPAPPEDSNIEISGFTSAAAPPVAPPAPPAPSSGKIPILLDGGVEVPLALLKETSGFLIYVRIPKL